LTASLAFLGPLRRTYISRNHKLLGQLEKTMNFSNQDK